MKAVRNAIPSAIRKEKSELITSRILAAPWFLNAENILVYSAIQSEVDLSGLYCPAWEKDKQLFFPKVSGKQMDFFCVSSLTQLKKGAFSVMEPDTEKYALTKFDAAYGKGNSVMLVPGVAFSADGYRIGYGGGYYDRYLALYDGIYTVGIAYEEQIVPEVFAEVHDYRLDEIISDRTEI